MKLKIPEKVRRAIDANIDVVFILLLGAAIAWAVVQSSGVAYAS